MDPISVWGNSSLETMDPEIHDLNKKKQRHQCHKIELITCRNFTSFVVIEALDNILSNKYFKGMPSNRYYGGNEYIDKIENLYKFSSAPVP